MADKRYDIEIANFLYKELQTKMPKKTGEMIRVALSSNRVYSKTTSKETHFKIGNTNAEKKVPYYHILEDAQRISYPNRGTKQTKGKQVSLPADERDFSQARYRRELRFKSEEEKKSYEGNSYINKHYHYIEKIIKNACIDYAHKNNFKLKITRRVK